MKEILYMKNNFLLKLLTLICSILIPYNLMASGEGISLNGLDAVLFKAPKDKADGKTIVILPGGGYTHHAMDHEGYDWIPFFNDLGVNVVILKYRLPAGNHEIPLKDVEKTFEILRTNSNEWNINPNDIGIMGFSAGGHLASTYATHSYGVNKPSFQILFYPVISLKSDLTHPGSRNSFLGEDQKEERILLYSNEEQVSPSTPPALIFHSNDDGLVVPDNSINYYRSLNKNGVSASLHIYPSGEHGWGFRKTFPYHEVMLEEISTWIKTNKLKDK